MRGIRCAVAAFLAAGMVAVVGAQPFRPGGGGGGGFDIYTTVLTNKDLQEELKVTGAQKEKLKGIAEKQQEMFKKAGEGYKEKFADAQGDKDKLKDLFTEMNKEFAKITPEIRKQTEAELTADQKKRLKQIDIQMQGMTVFADPDGKNAFGQPYSETQKATMKEVADALKLTDSQKTKIKDIASEYTKDRDAIRKDVFGDKKGFGGFDPEKQKDFQTKAGKLTTETMGKVAEVLDDTQKKAWKELVGDAFDTSKLIQPFNPPKKKD